MAQSTFDKQAVNARLWQDPLGVVIADQQRDKKMRNDSNAHSIDTFQDIFIEKCFPKAGTCPLARDRLFAEFSRRFQICAVMIPGGPYVEDVERRLRARRAVIEGLGEAGFVPEKDHELGYFKQTRTVKGTAPCASWSGILYK